MKTIKKADFYNDFEANVEAALRERFAGYGHNPSPENWEGIRAILMTIKAMALGKAPPKYHLSPLPTGMGKTTALVECVKELITVGEATGDPDGILILTNTLDQIPALIKQMGLHKDQYAVRTGKKNVVLNSMGVGLDTLDQHNKHDAVQVLFTTQQKFLVVASKEGDHAKLLFGNMHHLKYRHKPRAVRIWDESITPAQDYTVTSDNLDHLKAPFKKSHLIEQRDEIEALVELMKTGKAGDVVDIPEFDLFGAEDLFADGSTDAATVRALSRMAGGQGRLVHDEHHGKAVLSYEEILPQDFAPALILDACGKIRRSYALWGVAWHNLIFLPEGKKTYHNLAVRHWNHAAGKQPQTNNAKRRAIAEGVAEAVAGAAPEDKILIIVHKEQRPGQNMEEEINEVVKQRMAVEGRKAPEPAYLTWGKHMATNDFKDCKHVIVVGLYLYALIHAEAMARACKRAGMTDELTAEEILAFNKSEAANHLFQAAGRGHVRHADGDDCPKGCKLDVIYSRYGGTTGGVDPDFLSQVFPGAVVKDWKPKGGDKPTPNERELVNQIVWIATESPDVGGSITKEKLGDRIGITGQSVKEALRRPRVRQELARRGIAVLPVKGSHSGMLIRQVAKETLSPAEIERLEAGQARLRQQQAAKHQRIKRREMARAHGRRAAAA